jgi:DNA-binding NarL/FixJ family response regulator
MSDKNTLRVLIADDSDTLRERLISLLSENPSIAIIGEARDGLGAAILVEKLKPDVAILDIRMPRESGIDALKRINHLHPKPILVVLTNYPYHQYKEKCKEAGADYFFDKSTEFEKIPGLLERLIQNSKTDDSLRA